MGSVGGGKLVVRVNEVLLDGWTLVAPSLSLLDLSRARRSLVSIVFKFDS